MKIRESAKNRGSSAALVEFNFDIGAIHFQMKFVCNCVFKNTMGKRVYSIYFGYASCKSVTLYITYMTTTISATRFLQKQIVPETGGICGIIWCSIDSRMKTAVGFQIYSMRGRYSGISFHRWERADLKTSFGFVGIVLVRILFRKIRSVLNRKTKSSSEVGTLSPIE